MLMKKSLFTVLAMALTLSLNAEQYFFSPEGAGEADGSSWENAAAGEYLGTTVANAEPGTEFYLMEGSYLPDNTTNMWYIPQGITIRGGYPATATGTDTNLDYTTAGTSVFSADLDGDGKGDNTSYAFVYMGIKDQQSKKDEQFYKDTELSSIWGITFRDGARTDGKYWGNMVFLKHVKADFHFCQFINNVCVDAEKKINNAALVAWGCQLRMFDCIFRDNQSSNSGAAFLTRARNSDSSNEDAVNNGVALFERCEFTDNICPGTYGGGAAIADNAGTTYFVNCTMSGSYCTKAGGAFRNSTNDVAFFINNTFVNNWTTQATSSAGDGLSSGRTSTSYFANNVFVNPADKDKFDAANHAVVFLQEADSKAASAGYNVFGTLFDNGNNTFAATDRKSVLDNIYTQEKVFGTNTLTDNGGFSKTIAPTLDITGMTLADLQTAIAAWPIEDAVKEAMDITLDQRGYKRAATTMSGAIDNNATAPSTAVSNIAVPVTDNTIYTILGQPMGTDLNALPTGMYIQGGKKFIK